MKHPAKRVGKRANGLSPYCPELPPVSPRIPQRDSQHLPSAEVDRLAVLDYIADLEGEYAKNGNPICAWLAIAECLQPNLQLPAWVLEYLGRAGLAVRKLTRRSEPPDPASVVRALGLAQKRGARGVFRELSMAQRHRCLAELVWSRGIALGGNRQTVRREPKRVPAPSAMKVKAIIKLVAHEAGVSRETVWRAWRAHGPGLAAGQLIE